MTIKSDVYAWLDDLRRIPPSELPESGMRILVIEKGPFFVKRIGTEYLLYPPPEYHPKVKPIKYLIFAVLPIDFGNKWIKPAYFDEENYHGRADNWENWWSYWFGEGE